MVLCVWGAFLALIFILLALDLGVLHRKPHVFSFAEALAWTVFWIAVALAFNVAVYFMYKHHWLGIGLEIGHRLDGAEAALLFFTAYLVEKSLSVDNIFVIAMIFAYYRIPLKYQHKVLFWGILSALVLRGLMIAGGLTLIRTFSWAAYAFGAFLLVTAVKMLITRHDNLEPGRSIAVRFARRVLPVGADYEGSRFICRLNGSRALTPLCLALLMIESADILFAVDSIPAVVALTEDPFLVYTSNIFAILGLRSIYFVLAGAMERFRYLKMSLVFLLAFIGVKMMVSHHHPVPTFVSLSVIAGILGVGIAASVVASHRDTAPLRSPLGGGSETCRGEHADDKRGSEA